MSINSNEIIKKPDIVIDPSAFLPPGLVDARYPTEDEIQQKSVDESFYDEDAVVEVFAYEELPSTDEDSDVTGLLPPDSVIVVEQIIRTGENGQQVVDIILEVEDVSNSIQIDVRMAKV